MTTPPDSEFYISYLDEVWLYRNDYPDERVCSAQARIVREGVIWIYGPGGKVIEISTKTGEPVEPEETKTKRKWVLSPLWFVGILVAAYVAFPNKQFGFDLFTIGSLITGVGALIRLWERDRKYSEWPGTFVMAFGTVVAVLFLIFQHIGS